ncbi:hypothetical protein [Methylibium rhizosphaerae]|nr:hypothetical protein [Methylibium rhizosphaerae]
MTPLRSYLITLLVGLFAAVALAQTATEVDVAQVLEAIWSE